jgi:hypothetical protein
MHLSGETKRTNMTSRIYGGVTAEDKWTQPM